MPTFNYSAAKAAGLSDQQINEYIAKRKAEGVSLAASAEKPTSLLGSNKFLDAIAGITGGKQVARLGGALAFMGSKDKKAADSSQQRLDQLTQKYLSQLPAGDPRRQRALQTARAGYAETGAFQGDVANSGPNGRELAADVGKLAVTATGLKTPSNFTGRLALTRSVGAQTGLGAGAGALNAIETGKSPSQVATSAAASGVTAGALRGATGLLGRLFSGLTKQVPVAVYKTSTRIPNKADGELLLREGIVGGRDQLRSKADQLVKRSGESVQRALAKRPETVSGEDIFQYAPLQQIREQAARLGDGSPVDNAIFKVMPKPTGKVAEEIPETLAPLRDKIDELVGGGARPDQVTGLEREFVLRSNRVPLLELLKQRQAIDRASPPSVFTDRSTAMGARAEGAVADAMRRLIAENAPEVTPGLSKEAAGIALLKELDAYKNAKTSPAPYGLGNLIQRTILTPALGTRAAKLGYSAGEPFRKLSKNAIMEAIRRAAGTGTAEGLGKLFGR